MTVDSRPSENHLGGEALAPPRPVARPKIGLAGWATFVGVSVIAGAHSAFSMASLGYWSLTNDTGAQYHLSKLTAEGAVPLVDFQHGWNAGSWWIGGALYRLAGGDPTIWAWLNGRLLAGTLAAILLAAIGLRLRLHPAAMVAIVVGVLFVVRPASLKYALPIVWCFVLLPTPLVERRQRALLLYAAVPALLFWIHVELAVMLTAGTVLYLLVGARQPVWRVRGERALATVAGLVAGFVTEAVYYGVRHGLSVAELNRQVVLGQATEFPKHFGWPFLSAPGNVDTYLVVALFPSLVLLPFVPLLWRRTSDPTRFIALLAVCLTTVVIRRPGPGHGDTIGALVAMAVILLVCDLHAQRFDAPGRCSRRRGGAAIGGAAWAGLTVALGFGVQSLLAPTLLVLSVVLAALAARHVTSGLVWASGGALVVLGVLPLAATGDRLGDLTNGDDPYGLADALAVAIDPEVDQCLAGTDEALVVPTVLTLYDRLDLRNPTPYYLFHYDFGRNKDDVVDGMETGRIPAVIAAMSIPDYLPWFRDSLVDNYVLCSRVRGIEQRHIVEIWVHQSRAPEQAREVTIAPDGSREVSPLDRRGGDD